MKELFGVRFMPNAETKVEAIINSNNESVSVIEKNISGGSTTNYYKSIERFGVDSNVFCEAFNSAFKEHNDSVDKYLADFKKRTINKIKDFCEDCYLSERIKYLNERIHKDIYDICIDGINIRFSTNYMCFFTQKNDLAPIIFDISREDFDTLEKLYLKNTNN